MDYGADPAAARVRIQYLEKLWATKDRQLHKALMLLNALEPSMGPIMKTEFKQLVEWTQDQR